MKKILFTSLMVMCLTAFASAAVVQVDSFESSADYTTDAGSAGDSFTLSETTNNIEGSYALDITYDYVAEGQWYKNSSISKTFSSPIDISEMEAFKIDANVPDANSNFMMLIYLVDDKGLKHRFEDWTIFTEGTVGWQTRVYELSDLHKSKWVTGGKAINLKRIAGIEYVITNEFGATSDSSFSWMLDNARFETDLGLLQETVLEDFESYADDDALQAAWVQHSWGELTTPTLTLDDASTGSQACNLLANITGFWSNQVRKYDFAEVKDFSDAAYFTVSVKGDAALAGYDPIAHIFLVDTNGWIATGYMWYWPDQDEWTEIYLPFQNDGIGGFQDSEFTPEWQYAQGNSCWREFRWDGGGWDDDTDLSSIASMIIGIETGVDGDLGLVNIGFDDITVGYQTQAAPTSVTDWSLY